jgi:uncharacterized glyoxalase superfamily protein PhnB
MTMSMSKVAPTLIVERVETTVAFFVDRLGFAKAAEVPGEDGALAFAMLSNGPVEIHVCTRAAAAKDVPYLGDCRMPPACFLYIDVDDVAARFEALKDCDILVPLEKTFYGATHFFVREPGGHVIGLSQNE